MGGTPTARLARSKNAERDRRSIRESFHGPRRCWALAHLPNGQRQMRAREAPQQPS